MIQRCWWDLSGEGRFSIRTRWIIIGISREIEFDLRNDLFRQLERQPPAYYQHTAPATSWRG